MLFPLKFCPTASYKDGGRNFGANRDRGKRKHAGCDLLAPVGAGVFAVLDGTVMIHRQFYLGTYQLVVDHGVFVVRYGEIKKEVPPGITVGTKVKRGDLIGYIGHLLGMKASMLHFEMYSGTEKGPLTNINNTPFQRRKDLIDPTPYLDTAQLDCGWETIDMQMASDYRRIAV